MFYIKMLNTFIKEYDSKNYNIKSFSKLKKYNNIGIKANTV